MKQNSVQRSCKFCGCSLGAAIFDLGPMPLANSYLRRADASRVEDSYPLAIHYCAECFLVQLGEFVSPDQIFKEYAYLSNINKTWVDATKKFSKQSIKRFSLNQESTVLEIGCNDGYLLQFFVKNKIKALGIDPSKNATELAIQKGVRAITDFFTADLAVILRRDEGPMDLIIGKNVFAHIPDTRSLLAGVSSLLSDHGVLCLEFPHLDRLIEQNQFDTIYHEHYYYFSLHAAERILDSYRLRIFDVEELGTHGGSLRIWAQKESGVQMRSDRVRVVKSSERWDEKALGGLAQSAAVLKLKVKSFLEDAKRKGKRVGAYGAPAKGNTFLNYCEINSELISFTVDRNPLKQDCLLPGSHIPILSPDVVAARKPDYLLLLPWNLEKELVEANSFIRDWGGKFVVAIPDLRIVE